MTVDDQRVASARDVVRGPAPPAQWNRRPAPRRQLVASAGAHAALLLAAAVAGPAWAGLVDAGPTARPLARCHDLHESRLPLATGDL